MPLNSSSTSRDGNRTLKNLFIYSCTPLVRTVNRFGRHYDAYRAHGMRRNKALKAVARKRLKVIYAAIRNGTPYRGADATGGRDLRWPCPRCRASMPRGRGLMA